MNDERNHTLKEGISTLKDRLLELQLIKRAAKDELDHLPEMDQFDDLRDYYTDAVDSLDSVTSNLYYLIENMEIQLFGSSRLTPMPEAEEEEDDRIPLPQEKKPGFFGKLMLGLFGAHVAVKVKAHYDKERQEREQRHHDSVFWQEAARRDDPAYNDEEEDW